MTARATRFTVRGAQLLSAGQTMRMLARAPQLWVHLKVYAAGGENGLHAHPEEDHAFFVLSGRARFVDELGTTTEVGPFEGMIVPRGALYAFTSTANENLIMLRIGAAAAEEGTDDSRELPSATAIRVDEDGKVAPGTDERNKSGALPGVPIPGLTFEPPA